MIIFMDYFISELESVTCNTSLSLKFSSNETYYTAISEWDWVNASPERKLIMVVSYDGCQEVDARQPWSISSASYDAANLTVNFDAISTEWEDLPNPIYIEWGTEISPTTNFTKRGDVGGSHTFDLNHAIKSDFFHVSSSNGVSFNITCDNCKTKGSISVGGSIHTVWGVPTKAELSISSNNIEVDLNLSFTLSGTLIAEWCKVFDILDVPIPYLGWKIKKDY